MKRVSKFLLIFGIVFLSITKIYARPKTKIIVNGNDITDVAQSVNKDDRILVPIRFISEALNKEVNYIDYSKEVVISDVSGKMTLQIGSRLIELPNGEYILSDVPAQLINDRTYVPVRVIAESFNMAVSYDFPTNTVTIEDGTPNPDDSYQIQGLEDVARTIQNYTIIPGKNIASRIVKSNLFIVDPITKKGIINGKSTNLSISYTPIKAKDFSIILIASYDKNGNIVTGRGKKVSTKLVPEVSLEGVTEGAVVNEKAELMPKMNFIPVSLSYTVLDNNTGNAKKYENKDPFAPWQFEVPGGESRNVQVTINAIDIDGNNYISNPVNFEIQTSRRFALTGVKQNEVINKTVKLNVNRNFDVTSTRYYLGNAVGETLLKEKPYGEFIFNPSEDLNGSYYLRSEVTLPSGEILSTDKVNVTIKGGRRLLLQGVGPNAVITGDTELSYDSNLEAKSVKYIFSGPQSFTVTGIVGGKTKFSPANRKSGTYKIYTEIETNKGTLKSDVVSVKIHNEKIFGPAPIVPKNKFIEEFSPLAVEAMKKTGMAASIQMAQAILETGWGQYVPVDKYTGRISRNLFGIKGKGSAGSIISNTWEEYNGVLYRIDDYFRAYNSVNESWNDHKKLLLTKERYQVFRDVMFDYIRGAYAIRRAGYATDSGYPGKLIKIINDNNLRKLDEVSF